jgi:hypothetical protein
MLIAAQILPGSKRLALEGAPRLAASGDGRQIAGPAGWF